MTAFVAAEDGPAVAAFGSGVAAVAAFVVALLVGAVGAADPAPSASVPAVSPGAVPDATHTIASIAGQAPSAILRRLAPITAFVPRSQRALCRTRKSLSPITKMIKP